MAASELIQLQSKGAFGNTSVIECTPVLQQTFQHLVPWQDMVLTTDESDVGYVTHSNARVRVNSGATGSCSLQTKQRVDYHAGQGTRVKFTAVFSSDTVANASDKHYMGVGDLDNGLFVGYTWDATAGAPAFSFIHRSAGSDTVYKQSEWKKSTPFSTFDPTKGNVYRIQYAWLGFGPLVLSIQHPITHTFTQVHSIDYPSTSTEVSMRVPSLPIFLIATRSSSGSNMTIDTPSINAAIEGKDIPLGRSFGFASTTEHSSNLSANTNVALITMRNDVDVEAPFGGAASKTTNTIRVRLSQVSVSLRGTGSDKMAIVCLHRNMDLGSISGWARADPSSTCSVVSHHASVVDANLDLLSGTVASTTATSITLNESALGDMDADNASSCWVLNVPFVSGQTDTGQSWPVVTKTNDTTVTVPRMGVQPAAGRTVNFYNGRRMWVSSVSEGSLNIDLGTKNLYLNPGETITVVVRPTTGSIRATAALTWNEYS